MGCTAWRDSSGTPRPSRRIDPTLNSPTRGRQYKHEVTRDQVEPYNVDDRPCARAGVGCGRSRRLRLVQGPGPSHQHRDGHQPGLGVGARQWLSQVDGAGVRRLPRCHVQRHGGLLRQQAPMPGAVLRARRHEHPHQHAQAGRTSAPTHQGRRHLSHLPQLELVVSVVVVGPPGQGAEGLVEAEDDIACALFLCVRSDPVGAGSADGVGRRASARAHHPRPHESLGGGLLQPGRRHRRRGGQ